VRNGCSLAILHARRNLALHFVSLSTITLRSKSGRILFCSSQGSNHLGKRFLHMALRSTWSFIALCIETSGSRGLTRPQLWLGGGHLFCRLNPQCKYQQKCQVPGSVLSQPCPWIKSSLRQISSRVWVDSGHTCILLGLQHATEKENFFSLFTPAQTLKPGKRIHRPHYAEWSVCCLE
jgi:hypothetical protein